MSGGAHDSGSGLGRSASANALRGIVVIAAAVLVGVLLLNRGFDDDDVDTAAGPVEDTTTTTTVADPATTQPAEPVEDGATTEPPDEPTGEVTTTTAASAVRPPQEVSVLVLNGSGRQGEAGRGAAAFAQGGYQTADPKNAPEGGPSGIFYAEGYEQEAAAVATMLDLDPALVVRPLDPANPPIPDTQGANLVVMAGTDGLIQF